MPYRPDDDDGPDQRQKDEKQQAKSEREQLKKDREAQRIKLRKDRVAQSEESRFADRRSATRRLSRIE